MREGGRRKAIASVMGTRSNDERRVFLKCEISSRVPQSSMDYSSETTLDSTRSTFNSRGRRNSHFLRSYEDNALRTGSLTVDGLGRSRSARSRRRRQNNRC